MSFAERVRAAWRAAARTARVAVGVPDYETYVAHVRASHPDAVPMTRERYFSDRMAARYGKGGSRCC